MVHSFAAEHIAGGDRMRGHWSEAPRAAHYDDLCRVDGRIVLAGEHAFYLPAWQKGAILSSLDAIGRLHDRVVKG